MSKVLEERNFTRKPPRDPSQSKAPLYAEAFSLFVDEDIELTSIAQRLGLRPDTLVVLAQRQKWFERRTTLRAQKSIAESADRAQATASVDGSLVRSAVQHVADTASAIQDLLEKVIALPTADEDYKLHAWKLERKLSLIRLSTQSFAELANCSQTLGLLRVQKGKEADGGLDLSKLTQLNLTIGHALKQVEEDVVGDVG